MSRGGVEVVVFPRIAGGTVIGYCRKYTVGHGDWRGGRPGYHPSSRGDHAGVLPAPQCMVLQTWSDGVSWVLQVRVLRAPAVVGHAAVPDPPGRSAGVHTRRSGRHVEVPDPSRGEVRDFGCVC